MRAFPKRRFLLPALLCLVLSGCGLRSDPLLGTPGTIQEEYNDLTIPEPIVSVLPQQLELNDPDDPTRCRYTDPASGITLTYPAVYSLELDYTDGYARFSDETGAASLMFYIDDISSESEESGWQTFDGCAVYTLCSQVEGKTCYAILTCRENETTDFTALNDFSFIAPGKEIRS